MYPAKKLILKCNNVQYKHTVHCGIHFVVHFIHVLMTDYICSL